MASAKSLDSFIEAEISEEQQLRELLTIIESQKVVIERGLDSISATLVLRMMEEAKKISDRKSKNFEKEVSLHELLRAIQKNRMNVTLYKTEAEELMAQMPKTCPTCGQTLREE